MTAEVNRVATRVRVNASSCALCGDWSPQARDVTLVRAQYPHGSVAKLVCDACRDAIAARPENERKEAKPCAGPAGATVPGKPAEEPNTDYIHRGERREYGQHAAVVPPPGSADNVSATPDTGDRAPTTSPPRGLEQGRRLLRWDEHAGPDDVEWSAPAEPEVHLAVYVDKPSSGWRTVRVLPGDTAWMLGQRLLELLAELWVVGIGAPCNGAVEVRVGPRVVASHPVVRRVDTPHTVAAGPELVHKTIGGMLAAIARGQAPDGAGIVFRIGTKNPRRLGAGRSA